MPRHRHPDAIRHNVSEMALDDVLHIKDLKLPPGVKALQDEDLIVATVKEIEEEAAAAAAEGEPPSPKSSARKAEEGEEGAAAAEARRSRSECRCVSAECDCVQLTTRRLTDRATL